MSLDVWATIEVDGNTVEVFDGWNCTHNVTPMWALLLGGQSLGKFLERVPSVGESAPILSLAAKTMRANPDVFTPLNPENGWGNYETALKALEVLVSVAEQFPSATWKVSR